MINKQQFDSITKALFPVVDKRNNEPSILNVYAIIDGAMVKGLRKKLKKDNPEYCCLWAGSLAPDLQSVAPYLVKLTVDCPFYHWLINSGWGQDWNIFVQSVYEFKQLRKHLRQFLLVEDPEGETVVFRYYDPAVMNTFSTVCTPQQALIIYHNVTYLCSAFLDGQVNLIKHYLSAEKTLVSNETISLGR
ncbi:MAG: DUF4123 domain-containing protein [Oceanospirillaceae bacterium]|nr:DUF4123 domain-containing protein [Oceanospirillaceae bacterium]